MGEKMCINCALKRRSSFANWRLLRWHRVTHSYLATAIEFGERKVGMAKSMCALKVVTEVARTPIQQRESFLTQVAGHHAVIDPR